MSRKILLLLVVWSLLAISACQAQPTTPAPDSTASTLPRTEADVPRVSLEDARAAIESGEAVVVDVRNAEAYEASHIPGAIHIGLDQVEANPGGLDLDKDQWIITYCT